MLAPRDLDLAYRRALDAVGRALQIHVWPPVPLRWNRRLRRAGRAVIEGHGRRFRCATIEISPAYFEVYPQDLFGILVHEAVHVGLALKGLPFGHGPEFRRACESAGGHLHGLALPGRVYRYRCPVCGCVLERQRRVARDRWCADCAEAARGRRGVDPYSPERALILVGCVFKGPESRP